MKEYQTTSAPVTIGQGYPNPIPPPGDGWMLQGITPSKNDDGKPCLIWTWTREIEEGEDPESEYLVQ